MIQGNKIKNPNGNPAFVKGKSANPSGRPKRTPEELDLIAACKSKTPDALVIIDKLMRESKNDTVRFNAALAIMERGYGKPTQPIDAKVDHSGEIVALASRPKLTREEWLKSLEK